MKFIDEQTDQTQELNLKGFGSIKHVFDKEDILAVNAAIAAQRPLLLKGEPGVGKTQLAKAVAKALSYPLIHFVVDARTEARDLLWNFDSVQRLADAQILRSTDTNTEEKSETAEEKLKVDNYIKPGPLWWALDWKGAKLKSDKEPENCWIGQSLEKVEGCIVLIDEIDKAESDVPNGLLEVLGENQFRVNMGDGFTVVLKGITPLVIVTSNNERDLPDAFIRRCFVRHIKLPKDNDELGKKLIERGQAHFGVELTKEIYQQACTILIKERVRCAESGLRPLPGQAEYLDILRATLAISNSNSNIDADRALNKVAGFAVYKHTDDE